MFRFNADAIANSRAFYNTLKERELCLRDYKANAIENMGATQDQFDTIDMSDNEIKTLGNFPILRRLQTLLLSNNHIRLVDKKIGKQLVSLKSLIMTNNRISDLSEIDNLATLGATLEDLSLVDNPVVRRPNYRLYVIHKIPSLRLLDFRKVRMKERENAKRLFSSEEGKEMEKSIHDAKTSKIEDEKRKGPTPEQLEAFRKAIREAKTQREVDFLERMARAGKFPPFEEEATVANKTSNNSSSSSMDVVEEEETEKKKKSPKKKTKKSPKKTNVEEEAKESSATRRRTRSNSGASAGSNTSGRRRTRSNSGGSTPKKQQRSRTRSASNEKMDVEKEEEQEVYTEAELKKLRVVDLKKILKARKMDLKGRKADLIKRLVGEKK
eukprot:g2919.t1